jgi:hypothetical protein
VSAKCINTLTPLPSRVSELSPGALFPPLFSSCVFDSSRPSRHPQDRLQQTELPCRRAYSVLEVDIFTTTPLTGAAAAASLFAFSETPPTFGLGRLCSGRHLSDYGPRALSSVSQVFGHTPLGVVLLTYVFCSRLFIVSHDVYVFMLFSFVI